MPIDRDDADERLARIEQILKDINERTRRLEEFTDAARRRALEGDRLAAEQATREVKRLARRIRPRKSNK